MSKQKIRKTAALLAAAMVAVSCAVALPACTEKDAGELDVICELPDGTYQKHFIYLND